MILPNLHNFQYIGILVKDTYYNDRGQLGLSARSGGMKNMSDYVSFANDNAVLLLFIFLQQKKNNIMPSIFLYLSVYFIFNKAMICLLINLLLLYMYKHSW